MTEHNNPPAFPGLHPSKECRYADEGMSLLDHFAGLAMQALVAQPNRMNYLEERLAESAYRQANAMLKERTKWIKSQ